MNTLSFDKQRARRALRRKGWTQAKLARQLGSGEAHMSRVFNGLTPSAEFRARMEKALGEEPLWRARKR